MTWVCYLSGWNARQDTGPIRAPMNPSWNLMVLRRLPFRSYMLMLWLVEPLWSVDVARYIYIQCTHFIIE